MSSSGTSGADAPAAFHDLVAGLDYPMAIVTAAAGGERSGCLVGFVTQCSIHPPRYLVCVSGANHTHAVAARADALGIHVLDVGDAGLAEVFGELSGDTVDKLSLVGWRPGPLGVPLLDDAAGWFVGRVLDRHELGDHTGFVVEPVAADRRRWRGQLGYQAVRSLPPGHPA
ncbi:MAG TPA: flavin reductase family protein [Acidimicrobiales bacterium]|nr:flavin reductase family protein [Acidimicrobiales bacterium]